MLTRLDNAFSTQKQFSANAAHELRTPLAVLQTNLEVFEKKQKPEMIEYRQLFTMIKEQTARLSQLVGTLLDMTNLKSVPRTDRVSLAELTDEVFCDLDSVAQKAGITLLLDSQDCTVTGSYVLLYRAVYNLVENAIKYNRPQELRSKIAFGKNKTYFCQDKTPIMLKAGRTVYYLPPNLY